MKFLDNASNQDDDDDDDGDCYTNGLFIILHTQHQQVVGKPKSLLFDYSFIWMFHHLIE